MALKGAKRPGRKPHVVIVGTGAMASLFGARLARAGDADITLTGTWREALETIAARGLSVEEAAGAWTVPVHTVPLGERTDEADLVLVLVKAPRTAAVAPAAVRALSEEGILLSLQNGLGSHLPLSEAAGADRVAVGVTGAAATLLGPGHVRDGGGWRTTLARGGPRVDAIDRTARLLTAAGLDCGVEADILPLVWRKLAINCAINPLSALRGVPSGALVDDPDARRILEAAAREVGQVAAAQGIDLGGDAAELAVAAVDSTRTNLSSMLQDLRRGAATEIEQINGAVVREGLRLGVPTPVNESLLDAIRAREGRR